MVCCQVLHKMLGVNRTSPGKLVVQATRSVRYGPRSFAVIGPSILELSAGIATISLPCSVLVRCELKTELVNRAYTYH